MGVAVESDVDLHAPSHTMRYVGIAVGALVLGAAVWGFNSYNSKQDLTKLQGFDAFRAAYAEKCGVSTYGGPAPEVMRNAYLSTPAIQVAMDKELPLLNSGANCNDVVAALKRVDFALPAPGSAQ